MLIKTCNRPSSPPSAGDMRYGIVRNKWSSFNSESVKLREKYTQSTTFRVINVTGIGKLGQISYLEHRCQCSVSWHKIFIVSDTCYDYVIRSTTLIINSTGYSSDDLILPVSGSNKLSSCILCPFLVSKNFHHFQR